MTAKKHDDDEPDVKAEAPPDQPPKPEPPEADPPPRPTQTSAFPFTGSINEPQTVSLPLPQGTEIPVPSISSIDPGDAVVGSPDFTLEVHGTNFFADSVINLDGQPGTTTLDNDAGTLSTEVSMADRVEGSVMVTVSNGPAVSNAVELMIVPPADDDDDGAKKKRRR